MQSNEERLAWLEADREHLADRTDIADLHGAIQRNVAELRTEISHAEARIIKWMIASQVGLVIALAGLLAAVARFFGVS